MEYAYLVASLPHLELKGPLPLTSAELLRSCGGVLRRDHLEDLRAIVEGRAQDARAPEARALVRAETQLRNALARLRAQRASGEYAAALQREAAFDARTELAAARAMAIEDPLERETLLDLHRWALLEEASALPAFGVRAVFAYAFKLRLVEKWTSFDEESGLAVATQIVDGSLVGINV